MLKNLVWAALIGGGFLFGSLSPAAAALTINITNGDGVVNVETSGSFNLDALVNYIGQQSLESAYLFPLHGGLATGTGMADLYGATLYDLTSFGTSGLTNGTGTGGAFGLIAGTLGSPGGMAVPAGYVSGSLITSSATIPGSIASLGLTPGEHLTTFSFGGVSDTVVVKVAAVPEPAVYGVVLGAGLALLAIARRRRRR